MSPLDAGRGLFPRSVPSLGDGSKAMEGPLIHEGADNQSSSTSPSLGRNSGDAIDPSGRPGLSLAPNVHVGVLIGHSRRPQLIHRRCRRLKRPQSFPESALLHNGQRRSYFDRVPSR